MEKEIKERWTELYKQANLEFRLDLSAAEKMRNQAKHALEVYIQTGKIINYENEPDAVAIAKAQALRIAFEKLPDKEKLKEEFNRDFKLILDNFTSVTPNGAVLGGY
jgi:tRNA A37 N6-isopentenylltransferase MiaA